MKNKIILSIAGVAGALSLILGGCSLIGTGGNSFENDVKEERQEETKDTAVAEETKEAVAGDDSEKTGEAQADKEPATEAGEPAEGKEALPVTESAVGNDTNELAANIEAIEAEAQRLAREEQARVDEYNRQQEEYKKKLIEAQEEQKRQIEAQKEEYRKKVEEYNAEVDAYNKRMSNYYYNTNPMELINDVNINPGHIIYDSNGDLYATCYISNGKNSTVYDIVANYIELYDGNGNIIARDENVRIGNGGAIGGHSYNTWTFVFSGDKVKQSSADLTGVILCKFGVAYRF